MKILLVMQNEILSKSLSLSFEECGHYVESIPSSVEVLQTLQNKFDLLVVEAEQPDRGMELLSTVRGAGMTVPVMMVGEPADVEDKIMAFDAGANDYVIKPFDFRELEARARALFRKTIWDNQSLVSHGRLRFDTKTREVFLDDELLELTPREVGLLEALLQRPGRLVNKRHLIDRLASWDTEPSENAVEIVVHRLRRKLEPGQVVIHTVRGFGYLLAK